MFSRLFTALIIMIFSQNSLAGLGRSVPASAGFSQLCFFDMSPHLSFYGDICSGVLIDQQTIVTAAHCLDRGLPPVIRCGPEQLPVEVKVSEVQIHPQYQSGVVIEDIAYVVNDIAVLPLAVPVPAQPLTLISMEAARDAEQCAFFGFSKMSMVPRTEPVRPRFGWTFSMSAMDWMDSDHPIIQVQGLVGSGGLLEIGDSGGPLMCRYQGEWQLLGIASSRDYRYNSLFTPVINTQLVIEPMLVDTDLAHQAARSDLQFKLESLIQEYEQLLRESHRVRQWLNHPPGDIGPVSSFIDMTQDALLDLKNQLREKKQSHRKHVISDLINQDELYLRLAPFSIIRDTHNGTEVSIGDLEFNYFKLKQKRPHGKAVGDLRVIGPSDYFTCHGQLLCSSQDLYDVEINIEDLIIYGFAGDLI
jgi:hypothetical protein